MLIARPSSPQECGHRFLFALGSASLLCLGVCLQAQMRLQVEPHPLCSKDRGKTAFSPKSFQLLHKGPTTSCKSWSLLGQRALQIRTSMEISLKRCRPVPVPTLGRAGGHRDPELPAFEAAQHQHQLGTSQTGLGQWVNLLLKPQDEGMHSSM